MYYNQKLRAINFFFYLKESFQFEEEENIWLINDAINYLQKEKKRPINAVPYFQLTISKQQEFCYYLTFDEKGFRFSNSLRRHPWTNYASVDVRVNYKKGVEKESKGYIKDWVQNVQYLLKNRNKEAEIHSIKVALDTDFKRA